MCKDCGCSLPGETPNAAGKHQHSHVHGGDPGEHPEHEQTHSSSGSGKDSKAGRRTVQMRRAILSKNDRIAQRNRGFFSARSLLALNVLSSPGSGKTTFLRETAKALQGKLKTGIIVGDLATDNDAQRLRTSGAPVVQITTGTMCHLEADMISRALKDLTLDGPGLLIIENVGNLVCPASFDLGEDLRVVLFSVTEGEDKPLKYPPMFQAANAIVISKMDLATACDFKRDEALANVRRIAPKARVFETAAKTGQGMAAWCEYVLTEQKRKEQQK